MASFETRQKLINLGKELVTQLGVQDRTDTFSRWVAHYIAEQIFAVEQSTGEKRESAEKRCFEAILALWSHRNKLPDGLRPLESFEPVMRALARLDPEEPRSMYSHFQHSPKLVEEPPEVVQLVEFAISLDRVARILIDFAFRFATAKALRAETRSLLDNALPEKMAGDLYSIQELVRRSQTDAGPNSDRFRKRLDELERFCSLCESIKAGMKAELDALVPVKKADGKSVLHARKKRGRK